MIRPARFDELAARREIERRAGQLFRSIGMAPVADDEPATLDQLAGYQPDGRAWGATDERDRPVGYLLVELIDRAVHVEQLSVDPAHSRRGLGRALLAAAADWGRATACPH